MQPRNEQKIHATSLGRVSTSIRSGLSLLEVVLALAIMAIATAYLAQAMQIATTNGLRARKLIQAELIAESLTNQVVAGLIPATSTSWTRYMNSNGQTDWMYQIQPIQAEVDGMLGFQIAVQRVDPAVGVIQTQYDLLVNRWIIDPSLGLDTPPEEEDASGTTSGAGGI